MGHNSFYRPPSNFAPQYAPMGGFAPAFMPAYGTGYPTGGFYPEGHFEPPPAPASPAEPSVLIDINIFVNPRNQDQLFSKMPGLQNFILNNGLGTHRTHFPPQQTPFTGSYFQPEAPPQGSFNPPDDMALRPQSTQNPTTVAPFPRNLINNHERRVDSLNNLKKDFSSKILDSNSDSEFDEPSLVAKNSLPVVARQPIFLGQQSQPNLARLPLFPFKGADTLEIPRPNIARPSNFIKEDAGHEIVNRININKPNSVLPNNQSEAAFKNFISHVSLEPQHANAGGELPVKTQPAFLKIVAREAIAESERPMPNLETQTQNPAQSRNKTFDLIKSVNIGNAQEDEATRQVARPGFSFRQTGPMA